LFARCSLSHPQLHSRVKIIRYALHVSHHTHIAGILEKLTVLLIDHPHNMNAVLTVPKWQFYVMPFLAHGSLSLMPSLAEHAGACEVVVMEG
jgi:hypothetical protein